MVKRGDCWCGTNTGSDDLCNQLHLDNVENIQRLDIANLISSAFLEPMNSFNPLSILPPFDNYSFFQVNELEVFHLLERFRFGFQYLYRYLNLSFSQSNVSDLPN